MTATASTARTMCQTSYLNGRLERHTDVPISANDASAARNAHRSRADAPGDRRFRHDQSANRSAMMARRSAFWTFDMELRGRASTNS